MSEKDNLVVLPRRDPVDLAPRPVDDPISVAVKSVLAQPTRQYHRTAVGFFIAIGLAAVAVGAILPETPAGGVTWHEMVAFLVAVLAFGAAGLYRYAPDFWVIRRNRK